MLKSLLAALSLTFVMGISSAAEQPDVRILTDLYPPYSYPDANGKIIGISADKVRALMDKTGLSYQIDIITWNRAMIMAKKNDDVMIFPVSRYPRREKKFHWIMPVLKQNYLLLTANPTLEKPRNNAAFNLLTGVCSKKSAQCDMLKLAGLPESNIMDIAGISTVMVAKMLINNRADLMVSDPKVLDWHIAESSLPANKIRAIDTVYTDMIGYFVTSKKLNPALLKKIRAVASLK